MAGRLKIVLQAAAVAVVASLVALLAWRVAGEEESRGVGEAVAAGEPRPAPGFELERLDEEGTLSLSSLQGKAVVLNFWASWCVPCKEEAPVLEAFWQEHRDEGVVVVGIDAQDFRADARAFMEEFGLTYPIVHDGEGSTLGRYGVTGFPETWFVSPDGMLVGERIQGPVETDDLERNVRIALDS